MATLESKRTIITSGTHEGTSLPDKLRAFASSRPFTQQEGTPPFSLPVDVVFPSCATLEAALLQLQSSYWRCECTLSEFLQFAQPHVNEVALESKVIALGLAGTTSEDVWSLDSRGFLTLAVGKETYESLGLVGQPLPWKERADMHVIHISLRQSRPSADSMKTWLACGSKEMNAIRQWDARRGPWRILYHCDGVADNLPAGSTKRELTRTVQKMGNARIPEIKRELLLPPSGRDDASTEDREESVASFFEWVGMAALGSPRLSANDRCDPYIAVYTPPEPGRVGEFISIRWGGLIPSTFVQKILGHISSPNVSPPQFTAVTAHCPVSSPVTYLPPDPSKASPSRAPRIDGEDTWSLLFAKEDEDSWWILAESVGQWDKRWG